MTIQELRDKGWIIFEAISGSQAYGTNLPTSDLDIRGIFIYPTEEVLKANPTTDGLDPYIAQVSDETNDVTFFEIGRFLELLEKGNPNIIELLNVPEDCVIYKSELFDKYFPDISKYLTKQLKHTFVGYAKTQISKAKGMNKKIHNPQPKERKNLLDFCYVINGSKTVPFWNYLKSYYPYHTDNLSQNMWNDIFLKNWGAVKLPNGEQLFAFYPTEDPKLGLRGILKDLNSTELRLNSIPKELEASIIPIVVSYNLNGFQVHCKDHKAYWEWVENRNEDRYKDNMKAGASFDCYLDSETEYLTQFGWKKFDEVDDSCLLATIESKKVVFKPFLDKTDKIYSGDIYTYEDRYTKFSVTPNHNLYLSKFRRNNKNNESRIYNKNTANWEFITTEDYIKQKGECHYMSHLDIDYTWAEFIEDDWWLLLGAYLGDGHLQYKGNDIKEVRISQLESRPLAKILDKLCDTKYLSRVTVGGQNWVYIFKNEKFIDFIEQFGKGSKGKRIPHYFYNTINNSQLHNLLKGLLLSDGTINKNGSKVYYSTNKNLIDDIQLMLIQRGYYCQIYHTIQSGSYSVNKYDLYQLHIPKEFFKTYRILQKKNFTKQYLENVRITCFTVPNHILITRNSNKIAVQGNTKNMMHCVRLVEMTEDIINENKIVVRRPNRDFLLSIRNGEKSYEEIMDYVESKVDNLDKLFDESNLPDFVDKNENRELLKNIRLENINL